MAEQKPRLHHVFTTVRQAPRGGGLIRVRCNGGYRIVRKKAPY